jgi:hypothetical protein
VHLAKLIVLLIHGSEQKFHVGTNLMQWHKSNAINCNIRRSAEDICRDCGSWHDCENLGIPQPINQSTKGLWPHYKSYVWGITPKQVSNQELPDFRPCE